MSIEFDKLYFYMSLSYPEDGILEYLKEKHFKNKQQVKKFISIWTWLVKAEGLFRRSHTNAS